jgi:PleD family two-component response regulator
MLTVSIGVGTLIPTESDTPLAFVETVDQHLYKAKQNGRNRVQCA